ncbi:hypothetical protein F4604DRAFT_1934353 [Suillus subluteus]|nr:hypothetical protein F4604DRAFT_1934353 [Suillus subluteus]
MFYVNFNDNITVQHGVVLDNWLLKNFANPGDIGSMVEVRTMYNAFMTDATKFHKLTAAEWQDRDESRFNKALECGSDDITDEDWNALADESRINANIDLLLLSISQPVNTESQSVPTTQGSAPIQIK